MSSVFLILGPFNSCTDPRTAQTDRERIDAQALASRTATHRIALVRNFVLRDVDHRSAWACSHGVQVAGERLILTGRWFKMSASEGTPLWDSVTNPFTKALEMAFGCHHRKLSRVFTIEGHTYKVCCGCGRRFEYSLQTMSIRHRRRLFPALTHLRAQRRRKRIMRQHRQLA